MLIISSSSSNCLDHSNPLLWSDEAQAQNQETGAAAARAASEPCARLSASRRYRRRCGGPRRRSFRLTPLLPALPAAPSTMSWNWNPHQNDGDPFSSYSPPPQAFCSTTLFYGLAVIVCDLLAAARAFARAGPALAAIDSISLLRQRGALQIELGEPDAVGRVPVEVWTLIRQATVAAAVEQGRWEMAEEFHCHDCVAKEVEDVTRVECDVIIDGFEDDDPVEVLSDWLYEETRLRVEQTRRMERMEQVAHDDWLDRLTPKGCPHRDRRSFSDIEFDFWEDDFRLMVRAFW